MGNEKFLITGGAGFIGSHLSEIMAATGYDVTILDNLSTGSLDNIKIISPTIKIVQGDIRDEALVNSLISKVDTVIHLAAALGVKNIMQNPLDSISTNFRGSEVVLRAASLHKRKILIASTSEIYGKNPKQPLSEEDDRVIGSPQNYRWTYSDAKALEESTARILFERESLRVLTLRFFNTVGPRQSANYGMVMPSLIKSALRNEDLLINGSGEQTRVFCHVFDAVAAILKLLETENYFGEVFNIGGKGELSINELAERILRLVPSKSKIRHISYEEAYGLGFEDMQRRVPDTSKIFRSIGWEPKFEIDRIIEDIRDYYAIR
jgi:UDP-glucose 4-epimerase